MPILSLTPRLKWSAAQPVFTRRRDRRRNGSGAPRGFQSRAPESVVTPRSPRAHAASPVSPATARLTQIETLEAAIREVEARWASNSPPFSMRRRPTPGNPSRAQPQDLSGAPKGRRGPPKSDPCGRRLHPGGGVPHPQERHHYTTSGRPLRAPLQRRIAKQFSRRPMTYRLRLNLG